MLEQDYLKEFYLGFSPYFALPLFTLQISEGHVVVEVRA
jgi:hypothetical protein